MRSDRLVTDADLLNDATDLLEAAGWSQACACVAGRDTSERRCMGEALECAKIRRDAARGPFGAGGGGSAGILHLDGVVFTEAGTMLADGSWTSTGSLAQAGFELDGKGRARIGAPSAADSLRRRGYSMLFLTYLGGWVACGGRLRAGRCLGAAAGVALLCLWAVWAAASLALAQGTPPALGSAVVDGSVLTLTFSADLDVSAVPANSDFAVTVGGAAVSLQQAPTVAGPMVGLTLAAPATAGDAVTVAYDGTALQDTEATPSAVAAFGPVTATNETPLALDSAAVDGATLTLSYDVGIDASSRPAPNAFLVEVSLLERSVNLLAVSGSTVVLTLESGVQAGQLVTVSYVPPSRGVQSDAGIAAAGFDAFEAANTTAASAPSVVSAVVDGQFLVLAFDEDLDAGATPLGPRFAVRVNSMPRDVAGVEVYRDTVALTLAAPAQAGDAVTVSYLRPDVAEIQDLGGTDAAGWSNRLVTNVTATPVPRLWSVRAGDDQVVLVYSWLLDEASVPAETAFTVRVEGAARVVTGVAVEANSVSLTLASMLSPRDTVTVGYSPGASPLRDLAGEQAVALRARTAAGAAVPNTALARLAVPADDVLSRNMYPSFHPDTTHYALRCETRDTLTLLLSMQHPRARLTINGHSYSSMHVSHELKGLSNDSDIVIVVRDGSASTTYVVHCIPAGFPTITTRYGSGASSGLVTFAAQGASHYYYGLLDNNAVPVLHRAQTNRMQNLTYYPNGKHPYAFVERHGTVPRRTWLSPVNYGAVVLDADLNVVDRVGTAGGVVHTDGHDFAIKPNGNYVLLSYESAGRDFSAFTNPDTGTAYSSSEPTEDSIIQEVTADGAEALTWNSYDHMAIEDCLQHRFPADYAHVNTIDVLDDGDIIGSFRGCSQILRIDGATGDVEWRAGRSNRTTTEWTQNLLTVVRDPLGEFCGQHAASLTASGNLLLYDNGVHCVIDPTTRASQRPGGRVTRVVEYRIDTANKEVAWVRDYTYRNDNDTVTDSSGHVVEVDNGNWLISWGNRRRGLHINSDPNNRPPPSATFSEVNPDTGEEVFSMRILARGEVQTSRGHRVPLDGVKDKFTTVDETGPSFERAAVDGARLTVAFDEDLDESPVAANSDFAVTVNGAAADLENTPTVRGRTVTLTLASPVTAPDTVTVAYSGSTLTDTAAAPNAASRFGPSTAANEKPAGFADVDASSVHAANIEALFAAGVTTGCQSEPLRFCPDQPVSRAQMATFLARALNLEVPSGSAGFADVDASSVHAANIEALFAAGVTTGCQSEPLRFCPDQPVSRAQMATFLARALNLEVPSGSAGFADVDASSVHAANIEALFAAGVTTSCQSEPLRFCPDQPVSRAQMATFLARALNLEVPS